MFGWSVPLNLGLNFKRKTDELLLNYLSEIHLVKSW